MLLDSADIRMEDTGDLKDAHASHGLTNRLQCRVPSARPVACILAGGFGTRLRPLTDAIPKPMVPVAGRPFLQHQLERLAQAGVSDFVLAVGYRRQQIMDYFGDGESFGWSIAYAVESAPLGTGGAVANALPLLPERFLCLNGDTYLDLDWSAFLADDWNRAGFEGCVAIRAVPDCAPFGRVEVDGRRLVAFHEKLASAGPGAVNAGLYWFDRALFADRPAAFSLEHLILPVAKLAVHEIAGGFVDIGTFDTLAAFRASMEPHAR